jgi:hypothetical protein
LYIFTHFVIAPLGADLGKKENFTNNNEHPSWFGHRTPKGVTTKELSRLRAEAEEAGRLLFARSPALRGMRPGIGSAIFHLGLESRQSEDFHP